MTVGPGPDRVVQSGTPPREPFPLARLAAAYDLGSWRSVHWLTGGKNEHARVTTDRTTVFVRRSYRSKSGATLRWQLDLLRMLRERGLPVPRPLRSRAGQDLVRIDGRLFVITALLPGDPYDATEPAHLQAAGRTLAVYHGIVGNLDLAEQEPDRQQVFDAVRQRLAAVDQHAAPELTAQVRHVVTRLAALWPHLPVTVIHGGCRRGSLLFTDRTLTGVLDFDSARRSVRALDLAIAVHDIGKIYTSIGLADHKVALDLDRVERFLAAYGETGTATMTEAEALPLLIAAKRAQRALGRLARLQSGGPASPQDVEKVRLEVARLTWLQEHREELANLCLGQLSNGLECRPSIAQFGAV